MNAILLSGGSGKRLWPLSNDIRSKQFLKIFKKEDGTPESMVQRMCRMITSADANANITIATSKDQTILIKTQLDDSIDICVEPCRKDTFPAIALSTAYLHDIKMISRDDAVVVCPVDPYVEMDYFHMLNKMSSYVMNNRLNLVLMGIAPTYPSTKYGYIIPADSEPISHVINFKEKPDELTAKKYISNGALWNGGVFAFRIQYILDIAKKLLGTSDYYELLDNYDNFEKISFDYAVVEKEKNVQVMRFSGQWKDLGTWNTLTEAMSEEFSGNVVAEQCENSHIINELNTPLVALGMKNTVIVATPDGILVTEKNKSHILKEFVIERQPMYSKQLWGEYHIVDTIGNPDANGYISKHVIVHSGKCMIFSDVASSKSVWTFVNGSGFINDHGISRKIKIGEVVCVNCPENYSVEAEYDVHIIVIQV